MKGQPVALAAVVLAAFALGLLPPPAALAQTLPAASADKDAEIAAVTARIARDPSKAAYCRPPPGDLGVQGENRHRTRPRRAGAIRT